MSKPIMTNTNSRTTTDVLEDARAQGDWILVTEPAGVESAYRCLGELLPGQWVEWSTANEDGHTRSESVVRDVVHDCMPDVELVEEPPFEPPAGDADE